MNKLVFFDLDGTLIDNPSSEKCYIFWLITHGYFRIKQLYQVIKFTFTWFKQLKSLVFVTNKAYFYDLPISVTIAQAKKFTREQLFNKIRPYIHQLLQEHQARGDLIVLLTGSPEFIAEEFAKYFGITEIQATKLTVNGNRFSALPPLQHPYGQSKVTIAKTICANFHLSINEAVAYGNSIHDRALLEVVGTPVAVTPDRKLRKIALQKNWRIIEKS